LVADTGDQGVSLLNDLGTESAQKLLRVDAGNADAMRSSLAEYRDSLDISEIEQFAEDANSLNAVDGFENVIDDIATAGRPSNIDGALYEARVGAEVGPNRIKKMSADIDTSRGGEVDIVLDDGTLIEVKNFDLGTATPDESRYRSLENQLSNTYPQYGESVRDVTVVGTHKPEPGDDVYELAESVENQFESRGIEYNIRFENPSEI
jgi:hypothetical protein